MAYNASYTQFPVLRSFLNATTTVSYGNVLVWDTMRK